MKFQMIQYLLYPTCYSSFAIHYTCIYKFQSPNQGTQTIVYDLVDQSNTSNSEQLTLTIWEQKNRLKSVHIKLFSEYLQITNVFVEIRIDSRMIHELRSGQISNKHILQWIIQSVIDKRELGKICDSSLRKCWVEFFSLLHHQSWLENMHFSYKLQFIWDSKQCFRS